MPKHTDIPSLVYDNLRAVAESRLRRHFANEIAEGIEVVFPEFKNRDLFALMPDRECIDWSRDQAHLTEGTLASMFDAGLEANQ